MQRYSILFGNSSYPIENCFSIYYYCYCVKLKKRTFKVITSFQRCHTPMTIDVIIYYLRKSISHDITRFLVNFTLNLCINVTLGLGMIMMQCLTMFCFIGKQFMLSCVKNLHVWMGHTYMYCLIVSCPIRLKSDREYACFIPKDLSYPNGSHVSATLKQNVLSLA